MTLSSAPFLERPQPSGSNAGRSRAFNRSLVLGKVRAAGASGRAQIARDSGLSTQAVSNIIGDLVADGWLQEIGKRNEGRGQPAMQYSIAPFAGAALGIEIRPAAILLAIVGLDGQTLVTDRIDVESADPETLRVLLPELRDRALAQCQPVTASRVLGAGVVMPGPFGPTGLAGAATDLPGWSNFDPKSLIEGWLALPVTIENDANAAAMSERMLGVARDITSFASLYFGTGLGLGIVSDGTIERGAFGNAGEIGHIKVPYGEAFKPLEQAVSRLALQARMNAVGERAERIEDLERLLTSRHPALMDWLNEAGPALSHAIELIENMLDPQTIILCGALPESMLAALMNRIELGTRTVSYRQDRAHPRVMAGTCGRMTAPRGAAALVINSALTPHMAALA